MFQQDWLMLLWVLGYMQQSTLLERGEARKEHVCPIKESLFSDCDVFFSQTNWFLSVPVLPLVPCSQQSISSGCSLTCSAHSQAYGLHRFVLNLNRKLIVNELSQLLVTESVYKVLKNENRKSGNCGVVWIVTDVDNLGMRTGNVFSTAESYRQKRGFKARDELLQCWVLFFIPVTLYVINRVVV